MTVITAESIATDRLDLLPLRVEHAEEMAAVLSDPALHTFIGGTPYDPDGLRSRYRRLTAGSPDPAVTWLNWVVLLRPEGCLTGTVQATVGPSSGDPSTGDPSTGGLLAEVAWVTGTPWQRRGIAGEAARGLVGWLGGQPVAAVVAHVHPAHRASAAVATAAGLTPTDEWYEGEIRWHRRLGR
ncbi:GNAT family N-acetyltransferase [Streptomyces sp. CRN 30]|uniref:GNAT family N-acetyltransferase n=1 Tax=Streptomyces sp. CRN 30 TaxID=3075613 RepID=UPI002A81F3D9|nr:GNAT family N-acetyltransferase [Streptomyces sp. CRN 30]